MNAKYFNKIRKGKISISSVRVNSTDPEDEDYISIRVEDELSDITFLEVEMDLKSFASALTGFACEPIKFGIRGTEKIGMKREVKQEKVQLPKWGYKCTDAEIKKAMLPFEKDGWIGRLSDCKNRHNYIGDQTHKVIFVRWVDTED